MNKFALVNHLKSSLEKVSKEFNNIKNNSDDILTLKQRIDKWSAIECIEHLNITARFYFPQIKQLMEESDYTYSDDELLTSSLFGKMMIKSMKPKDNKIVFKMNTFDRFKPPTSLDVLSALNEFGSQLKMFEEILNFISKSKIKHLKVNSALGSIIKFKLSDALIFLIAHIERHLIQAKKEII